MGAHRMVPAECRQCGRTFRAEAYKVRLGLKKFCGRSCQGLAQAARIGAAARARVGALNPMWRGGISQNARAYVNRFRVRHPEKARAHDAVRTAIRNGRLVKASRCENCGLLPMDEPLHGHHDDYAKPLTVRWLCRGCHHQADRARRLLRMAAASVLVLALASSALAQTVGPVVDKAAIGLPDGWVFWPQEFDGDVTTREWVGLLYDAATDQVLHRVVAERGGRFCVGAVFNPVDVLRPIREISVLAWVRLQGVDALVLRRGCATTRSSASWCRRAERRSSCGPASSSRGWWSRWSAGCSAARSCGWVSARARTDGGGASAAGALRRWGGIPHRVAVVAAMAVTRRYLWHELP